MIGVPLHWQHRTTLDGSGLARNEDLIRRREQNVIGFPILYVACWSIQWELLGYAGPFEYSVALTSGSPSNPSAADEDGVAFLGRAGLEPVPGIRFGVSAAVAPYLGGRLRDAQTMATSYPGEPKDYLQRTAGLRPRDLNRKVVNPERGVRVGLGGPSDRGEDQGLVRLRRGIPRLPSRLAVGRTRRRMKHGDISSTNDGLGPRTGWDDDVFQVESALSYRLAREALVRVGWQHTRFLTGSEEPTNLVAVQLKAVF